MDLKSLSTPERTLLARLSPFRAGLTLDAVDDVLRVSWPHLEDPFDVLDSLVGRAYVLVEDPPRYRILPSVREEIRAHEPGESALAMQGLFDWADGFCAAIAVGTAGPNQEGWFERTDAELDNLLDAIEYGKERADLRPRALRMAVDLRYFWAMRGHFTIGRGLIEPALDDGLEISADLRANATNLVGVLAMGMGDLESAERRLTESLALAQAMDDAVAQGGALGNLGMIAWERLDFVKARESFQQAAIILRGAREWAKLGIALLNLGCVLIDMERFEEAKAALEESREPLRQGGNLGGLAFADGNLGYLALVRGNREEAALRIGSSLDAFGRLGNWKGTMNTLISAANFLSTVSPESAATIRGVIEAMGLKEGILPTPREELRLREIDRAFDSGPGAETLRTQRTKGLAMSPQQGIDYALSAMMAMTPPAR